MNVCILYNTGNNALTGAIPTEIGLLRNLTVLDLGNNGFEERIPREVHSLKNLQLLYLGKLALFLFNSAAVW